MSLILIHRIQGQKWPCISLILPYVLSKLIWLKTSKPDDSIHGSLKRQMIDFHSGMIDLNHQADINPAL